MPRKEHLFHYIYKTTCVTTGRFYIGMHSTSNKEDGYIGSGKRLWNSIRKHGKENHVFEILEFLLDRVSLKEREKEIVNKEMLKDPMCMNLQLGGCGEYPLTTYTNKQWLWENDPIWRAKKSNKLSIASSRKRKPRPDIAANGVFTMKGRHHTKDTVERIKKTLESRVLPEDHGKHVSETLKQRYADGIITGSQTGTCWVHNDVCNKKIQPVELEVYLNNGWIRGSKRSFFNEDKSTFRTHWVNDHITNIKIRKDELETYLSNGWVRGKSKRDDK